MESEMPSVCHVTSCTTSSYGGVGNIVFDGTSTTQDGWGCSPVGITATTADVGHKYPFKVKEENKMKSRLIEYYVLDKNKHLIEKAGHKAILRSGCQLIAEDDQSFIIGLGIPQILGTHNEFRTAVEYEEEHDGRTVTKKLKPAKIRDLTIVIREIS